MCINFIKPSYNFIFSKVILFKPSFKDQYTFRINYYVIKKERSFLARNRFVLPSVTISGSNRKSKLYLFN
jgi:hypothetical protein